MDNEAAADLIFDFLADVMGPDGDQYSTTMGKLMGSLGMDLAGVRGGLQVLIDNDTVEVIDAVKDSDLNPGWITRGRPIVVRTFEPVRGVELLTEWFNSGWSRLLPPVALQLVNMIEGPTSTGISTSLDQAESERSLDRLFGPEGLDSPIVWELGDGSDDDVEQRMMDAERRARWESVIMKTAHRIPGTVRQLAHLLVELGVFEHSPATDTNPERWAVASPLPDMANTLPVGAAYAAEEARILAETEGYRYSGMILEYVLDALDRRPPGSITVSVGDLAANTRLDSGQCRVGLQGLVDAGEMTVTDGEGRPVDLVNLDDAAEVALGLDWAMA